MTYTEVTPILNPVYAKSPHPKVSERYGFIPTEDIISEFNKHGFVVSSTTFAKNHANNPHKGYGQHMVRMRREYDGPLSDVVQPTVVIINSHDRTKAFRLGVGMDVFACLNGLISGDMLSDTGRLHHTGKNLGARVLEYISESSKTISAKIQTIKHMREYDLEEEEIEQLCYTSAPLVHQSIMQPLQLAYANRVSGMDKDLWTLFNNIQENSLKGNFDIESTSGKVRKARPITNITKSVKVNAKLWELAESIIA